MILIKIYIFFFILAALLIALYIALGKRRRKASPPAPLQKPARPSRSDGERGEDRAKEGEEILKQIFNNKNEKV